MTSLPKRKQNLAWRKIEDEVVIIDLDKGRQFHELNDSGSRIWELCDGETSVDDIASALTEDFELDLPEAHKEVTEFITYLTEKDLLT